MGVFAITNIQRYIIIEVSKPLIAVLAILAGLFACFSSARYLAEAITETLGVMLMLKLVMLKTLIALEVLVPIALYISVVIGLGRLHRDQEIIALRAAGLGGLNVISAVILIAVPIGIAVGLLSVVGRPWAYQESYLLDAIAEADLNTDRFQAGRFYGNEDSGRVVYIKEKEEPDGEMKRVFHYTNKDGVSEVIFSSYAKQHDGKNGKRSQIHLFNGILYRLIPNDVTDEIINFEKLVIFLEDPKDSIGYKRKAASTMELMNSDISTDVAELQWRLSRPFATILLALIAVPLSKSTPRQGKNEKIFTAALVFAVYYNLSGLARTWVEQGIVNTFPGIWWLHSTMLIVVVWFLYPDFRKKLVN